MWQSRDTIFKVIEEINSNYNIAKEANENATNIIRIITKETLSHSFEMEKSEITSVPEMVGNAVQATFTFFMNERKKQKKIQKLKNFLEKKKIDEENLWNDWNVIRDKLKSLDAENLFEIIKINRLHGFYGVSRYIFED